MKILITIPSGMNDCMSILNDEIDFCINNGISLDNIYFHSCIYDFSLYFDFKYINYLKPNDNPYLIKYDKICDDGDHSGIFKNIGTDYHISKFVSIKKEFLDLAPDRSEYVGIHCRSLHKMRTIHNTNALKDFLTANIKKIRKVINDNDKVCIFSDTDLLFQFLPFGDNIIHEHTGCLFLENPDTRAYFLRETIYDIIKMARCKKVYYTNGFFWKLAIAFVNNNLEAINLETVRE